MALFYKAVKSTMATKSGDKKWHLNLVKVGKVVSTQQLAEMIAEKSSLTPGDVHNVVRNLMTAMRSALLDSKTVRLDGLGTFTMKARTRGRGVDKEEEVNPNQWQPFFVILLLNILVLRLSVLPGLCFRVLSSRKRVESVLRAIMVPEVVMET